MTHDERIDAIARAMHAADVEPRKFDAHWNVRPFDEQHDEAKQWWYRMAAAALAAADVEGMVRAAAVKGINHGARERYVDTAVLAAIVREVMGK
jgi:hypothetical protein